LTSLQPILGRWDNGTILQFGGEKISYLQVHAQVQSKKYKGRKKTRLQKSVSCAAFLKTVLEGICYQNEGGKHRK
jgi:hypothetical protein